MSTRRLTFASLALAVVAPLLAGSTPAAAATADPVILGHRGQVTAGTPENSLRAFETAARSSVSLETDVRFTKDGGMVLVHDETLTRTTNCTGTVENKTLAAVLRCKTADGKPVMTFDQLLTLAKRTGDDIDAEVKAPGLTYGQAQRYVDLIAKHGMTERVLVTSFYSSNLRRVKAAKGSTGLRYGIIDYDRPHSAAEAASKGSVVVAHLGHTDAARVRAAHAEGLLVYVWTLRREADFAKAKSLGVDGIITDAPAAAAAYLATH